MKTFDQDVKKFHTWFKDKRKPIIKSEKGDDSYKEYIRCLFKTYKTSSIETFREPIVQERTKWITGSQSKTYDYTDIMTFASKFYVNLEAGVVESEVLPLENEKKIHCTFHQVGA